MIDMLSIEDGGMEISVNLDYIRYFVKLAEVQHYTKAANQLCISQPSLSHAIHQMEEELGVSLFEKRGHNTKLTKMGEEFLMYSRQTLSVLDEGIASMQRSAKGEGLIRLGFLRVLGVHYIPGLAMQFKEAYPELCINFEFHSGRTRKLLDGLVNRQYDLVFCSKPSSEYNVSYTPVVSQDLVLIVSKKHPLANRQTIDLVEVADYPQIYFSRGSGLRDVIDELFASIHVVPHIAYETEEDQVIAGLVAQNFGIAIVPYMDILLKLDVSIIHISTPAYRREIFMVTPNDYTLPPVARNYHDFVLREKAAGRSLV